MCSRKTAAVTIGKVMTSWAGHVGLDLSSLTNVSAFSQRIGARPAVQAALKAEGLLK